MKSKIIDLGFGFLGFTFFIGVNILFILIALLYIKGFFGLFQFYIHGLF